MSTDSSNAPAVDVRNLGVQVLDAVTGRYKPVLHGVDVCVAAGQALGITGQSGAGKSTLALALAGLLPASARVTADRWELLGRSLWGRAGESVSGRELARRLRRAAGRDLFLISQDARSSLIPYRTVRWHLARAAGTRRRDLDSLRAMLVEVGFKDSDDYLHGLPAQLSTGECQRVQLAMAHRLPHQLLLADEPFASVDASRRALLAEELKRDVAEGHTLILITHSLALLRQVVDQVLVIDDGRAIECGPMADVLDVRKARHLQTQRLLRRASGGAYGGGTEPAPAAAAGELLLAARDLTKRFRQRTVFANRAIELRSGQRIGLFGVSGGGKTTFARILMGLTDGTTGQVVRFPERSAAWQGTLTLAQAKALWHHVQLVYQDTDLVFDPAAPVGEALVQAYQAFDPGLSFGTAWRLAGRLVQQLHLPGEVLLAPPGPLSGGERRRAALARALARFGFLHATAPPARDRVLILDEPTVGIDVFLQSVVAETLLAAQRQLRLSYLVISHDREFVERFCQRVYEWPV